MRCLWRSRRSQACRGCKGGGRTVSDRLFDVEELFSAWVYRLKKENLGTCSYEDFIEMCGTPSCFHVCCTQAKPYHATPRHATPRHNINTQRSPPNRTAVACSLSWYEEREIEQTAHKSTSIVSIQRTKTAQHLSVRLLVTSTSRWTSVLLGLAATRIYPSNQPTKPNRQQSENDRKTREDP